MGTSFLGPLIAPFLGRPLRQAAAPAIAPEQCPHCSQPAPVWPTGLAPDGTPFVCTACGGLIQADAAALQVCTHCGQTHERSKASLCEFARADVTVLLHGRGEELAQRTLGLLQQRHALAHPGGLDRYVGELFALLGCRQQAQCVFLDSAEPLSVALPDHALVLSLGLLAALEDEAQLAFVLARELALDASGLVLRRFATALSRRAGFFERLAFGADEDLSHVLDLSLRVGYGPRAEREADRQALTALVRADYDPQAGFRALRLLESATLSGQGSRFLLAADRASLLEQTAEQLGVPPTARLNREVYRRAVGGFAVFAHAS